MTEPKVKKFIPAPQLAALVKEITTTLSEPNVDLISRIVIAIGEERARALLDQVLAIEADGGQMTLDGTRRKTPGGLFISKARAQAGDKKERRKLLDQSTASTAAPAAPLTWEEAQALLARVF